MKRSSIDIEKDKRPWNPISTAPEGRLVDTKIDDEHGERNHTPLLKDGRLWWMRNKEMYVYYTPTHWRDMPPSYT